MEKKIINAKEIGDTLGINWNEINLEQFEKGILIELEHGSHDTQTDVTHDDPYLTGKIAWAHLKEIPNYYTLLEEMESKAKHTQEKA